MLVKSLADCPQLVANDGCLVYEVLNTRNDAVDLPYSLAVAEVAAGERSYRHRLRQTEVYYVLDGRGRVHVNDEAREVAPGDAVLIPGGATQWIENIGDGTLRFAALVSPPYDAADDERLE